MPQDDVTKTHEKPTYDVFMSCPRCGRGDHVTVLLDKAVPFTVVYHCACGQNIVGEARATEVNP